MTSAETMAVDQAAPNLAALLDAGAVLPTGTPLVDDDTVDTVTARAYHHPVLPERRVVRLVPATVGEAEDLTMEFLGFTRDGRVEAVGHVRQQALGFPAWALVHDPANGHHALALVKDVERLARVARSRIGPARDGFVELGERLARSVPHFLPTFYEQAGRAFLAADSATYAATMFGKAREAERVYALDIDEERQHAVFLEFALAGALTAKALSTHARDLAARCEPATAYERFRRLCVERTLGGLPPYAAMHTDLRRLAKAAKINAAEADEAVLRDLIVAPALARAPEAFWTAYQAPLARLAADDPALRGRLLGMFPKNCADDVWLATLTAAGALAALTEPAGTVPPEAESPDGPAGWLRRFDEHREGRYWRRRKRLAGLLELVERMAPRLIADGRPIELCRTYDFIDLDLVDACLALGVPVADPEENTRLYLDGWFSDESPGRRDLAAFAADDRFRNLLADSVESSLPDSAADSADGIRTVLDVPGLRVAVRDLLDRLADAVPRQGLPTLGRQLDRVAKLACPDAFAVNPEAARRIVGHDVGPVLGRTLRAGVLDEYGWPALEAATARLAEIGRNNDDEGIHQLIQWPWLVLRRGTSVLVVGHDDLAFEHLIRIPKGEKYYEWSLVLRYVDGQLLVCWDRGPERAGYWSGAPDDLFTTPDAAFSRYHGGGSLPLPGGGRTCGGRPLHVGDRSERVAGDGITSDGTTYWVLVTDDGRQAWVEYDPATGERGRPSLPAFFEAGAVDGEPLVPQWCRLRPAGDEFAGSPLGWRDGLAGWRVRATADGGAAGEGIDGRSFTLVGTDGDHGERGPIGALRFPGSDAAYGVLFESSWNGNEITLCDADGFAIGKYKTGTRRPAFAEGTVLVPEAGLWHHLRPRDPAGSALLRTLPDERAGELLAGAAGLDADGVRDLVARSVPEISDPSLGAGVAGIVRKAARHAARLATYAAVLDGEAAEGAEKPATAGRADGLDALYPALEGLIQYCAGGGRAGLGLIEAAAAALTGPGGVTVTLPGTDRDWFDVFGLLPAAMYRAAAPQTPPGHREALLVMLESIARSGLAAEGSRVRRLTMIADAAPVHEVGAVVEVGDRRLVVLSVDRSDNEVRALEFAPDGVFGAVPGFRLVHEQVMAAGVATPAAIESFVALVRDNGPAPVPAGLADALSQAAGMSHAEAVLLLAALPGGTFWDDDAYAPQREALGLSATVVGAARGTWRRRSRNECVELLGRLLPDDPAALWRDGPPLDRVVAWWGEQHGARTPVDDELIVTVDRAGVAAIPASELLHGIANARTCRWLARPVAPDGESVVARRIGSFGVSDLLTSLARALPWLGYHLPAKHPIRAALPVAAELARELLADPVLATQIGYLDEKKMERLAAALGATPRTGPDGVEIGPFLFPPDTGWRKVLLRPGLLEGIDDPALAVAAAQLDSTYSRIVPAIRALLGEQLPAVVAYDPDAANTIGCAQDPSRSAPDLVAEVAGALGLGADAATLYLQLLALPDPTDRNVARWTEWKPARLKAARAELAATDLVVEAKRPRAGRSLFLPGGWLALKAPHLPLERWKLGLVVGDEGGVSELGIVIPVAPPPRLFEVAWARVRDGDAPRFDELVTGRGR